MRFLFAALVVMMWCAATSLDVYAEKRKKPNYGTIKIQSNPPGLPLELDGKPSGMTTADYTSFERLEPGLHTIVVILPDGQRWTREINLPGGRIKCVTINYRPAPVVAKLPCPYPVQLSAPTQSTEGSVITFAADVAYSGTSALLYTWTVTPAEARIISGAGTPRIEVDSTGLGGQRIMATLLVDDGSGEAGCRQTAQVATFIPQAPRENRVAREFDVCCNCSYDDQKARLDNLAIELQNDPSATAYVIAYGGRGRGSLQADRLLTRAREYLVNMRGIDPSRIVSINGGLRDDDCVEVWIVPQGAQPPTARASK